MKTELNLIGSILTENALSAFGSWVRWVFKSYSINTKESGTDISGKLVALCYGVCGTLPSTGKPHKKVAGDREGSSLYPYFVISGFVLKTIRYKRNWYNGKLKITVL